MATAATDDAEDITKCPICFETYKSPKYLPCSHTLCETCLSQYITSVFKVSSSNTDINKQTSFPCPICRLDVPVSDQSLSPEEIASKQPVNHLIVTLLDQRRLKSKDKECDPCSVYEKHTTAVSWCTVCNEALCTNCVYSHKAMKMSRNHRICPLEEIQSETKTITSLEFCTLHEDEKVKLYCVDHEQACCSLCVTIHHRKCEHVKTLNEAAEGIQESSEIEKLSKSLKTMIYELTTVLEGRKTNQRILGSEKQRYQEKIAKMRQDINKHLDQLEEWVNQGLGGRYKESSILIADDIALVESNLKILSNCQKVIESGLKNVSDIHKFLEMNKIKQQHRERSELLKKRLDEMKNHEIEIQFDDSWMNLITNLTKIGTVTSTCKALDLRLEILGVKVKTNLQNCTARQVRNTRTGQLLSDVTFLPNDNMLLVDNNGRKVIFCTLEGQVQRALSLSSHPFGIVQIDNTEAAVVLKNTQNIQYIDIVNCKLGKLITVSKELYQAIGYNGTNLIVGGSDRNIYMIDRTGNIIKTLALGYITNYITCTADRIYLTPGDQLVCLDMNGSLIFTYTNSNFSSVQGVSVDKEGNIYCCGYSSHNIHQLTPDGQLIKLTVTDIKYPRGIAFDKTSDRFLVTHNNNGVTVYELTQSDQA